MITSPHTAKLRELRQKTDRELKAWINRRLDLGLQSYGAEAEAIYLEVAPMMLVLNAEARERRRLESKLEQLAECFGVACMAAG
jgi:hypothetical protein